MIYLRIQFCSGRFHATPWGSHVNEGLAEWPPSPWRILRGLIAVGFTHLHWHPAVPDDATSLINKLAACLPRFSLPSAIETHTRHYMPVHEGSKVSSAKVFDTCVRIAQSDAVWVQYDVELDRAETALLESLAVHLAYLGRAESWVDVTVHPSCDTERAWVSPTSESSASLGEKLVHVLATVSPEYYGTWRSREIARGVKRFIATRGQGPTPNQRKKLEIPYPSDLVNCLVTDTASLQKAGWSHPPGSQWVYYSIPQSPPTRAGSTPQYRNSKARPQAALLCLTSDSVRGRTLPSQSVGVFVGENLHKACVAKIARLTGDEAELSILTGRDRHGARLQGHRHAHFLPLCLQGDRRHIDHILVFARDGFGTIAQRAIADVEAVYAAGLPKTHVTLLGFGDLQQVQTEITAIASTAMDLMGTARVFKSITPFVASRHLKPKRNKYRLEHNVADECGFRGLPQPSAIGAPRRNQGKFRIVRFGSGRQPPQAEGWFLEIEFEENLGDTQLPLALGYGSHFGLGLFRATN